MSSPVRPSQFSDILPSSTASVCENVRATLIQLPDLISQLVAWMLDSGGNFTSDFQRMLQNSVLGPGAVQAYASSTTPEGWLACNGQEVSRTAYDELFEVIGTLYGSGDGINTFNLPDIRGRTIIGSGTGTGLTSRTLGDTLGEEEHALTAAENGPHTHDITLDLQNLDGGGEICLSNDFETAEDTHVTEESGNGTPHNNMQPSIVLRYFIKY